MNEKVDWRMSPESPASDTTLYRGTYGLWTFVAISWVHGCEVYIVHPLEGYTRKEFDIFAEVMEYCEQLIKETPIEDNED